MKNIDHLPDGVRVKCAMSVNAQRLHLSDLSKGGVYVKHVPRLLSTHDRDEMCKLQQFRSIAGA